MEEIGLEKIKNIFEKYPSVKLAYFFGSKATGTSGPLSDYDFAVYLEEKDAEKMFEIKFKLNDEICRELKTDKVDIAVLNLTESSEFKYNVIKYGKLILEREPFKVIVEPRILNEYFDLHELLLKYNLTKS